MKINKWLLPVSWTYGLGVWVRNEFFNHGLLHSQHFDVPVISVGNITVGGTGKTPHVEYLIRLLKERYKVAVLSRGYKRRTKGYVLSNLQSTALDIGDEPYQMKVKFPKTIVAVDANRREGIRRICQDPTTRGVDVILLDDAYQHRYVRPSLNILLVDYNRPIFSDELLPAGRLRESIRGKKRADIVIVTKCPPGIGMKEMRTIEEKLALEEHQSLFFTSMAYLELQPMFCGENRPLETIHADEHILVISGIAEPGPMIKEIQQQSQHLKHLSFGDHHHFTKEDIEMINIAFESLPEPKIAITTEKDAARLTTTGGLCDSLRRNIFILPIEVRFLQGKAEKFNKIILRQVGK